MKSNSRRTSITMKRYSESIKSSARLAPPLRYGANQRCERLDRSETLILCAMLIIPPWIRIIFGGGQICPEKETNRLSARHRSCSAFSEASADEALGTAVFIAAAMGMQGQNPGHPAPNPETNRSMSFYVGMPSPCGKRFRA